MASVEFSSKKDWTSNLPIEMSQDEKNLFPEPPMKLSGPRNANFDVLDWRFSERSTTEQQRKEIRQKKNWLE